MTRFMNFVWVILFLFVIPMSCRTSSNSIESLRKKADNGDVKAQMKLFYEFYEKRNEGKENLEFAIKYLKMAAEKENPSALNALGILYYDGYGVEKNINMAFDLHYKAAYLNHRDSQYYLSCCYYMGTGTSIDEATAYAWLIISYENGNKSAAAVMDKARLRMKSEEMEVAKRKYNIIKSLIKKDDVL